MSDRNLSEVVRVEQDDLVSYEASVLSPPHRIPRIGPVADQIQARSPEHRSVESFSLMIGAPSLNHAVPQ